MGTGDEKEPLDVATVIERLNAALPLQLRSAVAYTIAPGYGKQEQIDTLERARRD